MDISFNDNDGVKENADWQNYKNVLAKLEEVQNIALK